MKFATVTLIVLTALVYAGTAAVAPALGFRPAQIATTDSLTAAALPTISGVDPNSGPTNGGTIMVIRGNNFATLVTLTVGGVPATDVTVLGNLTVVATTPAHAAGAVDVVVVTSNGTATLEDAFTYIAPMIIGVSPASGSTDGGTPITITGAYLTGASSVTVGRVAATNVTVLSDTTVTATTPAHAAGAVALEVVTPNGTVTSVGAFTYVAPDVPSSSGSGGAVSPPVTTPAATSAVAIPPASGTWTTNTTTDVITSRFAFKLGTVYSIKATKSRITREGTCRKTGATVTCKVKAPNGLWKITVTPKTGAKAGKAIVRFVRT